MPDRDDAQLDALMRRHLSAELDGQAGRAEAAFLRHVHGGVATASERPQGLRLSPAPPPRTPRRFMKFGPKFGPWMVTWAGTALAACLAALWAGPALFPVQPAGSQTDPGHTSPVTRSTVSQQSPMLHYVHNRTWDEGPVVLDHDGTPVPGRRIRRSGVEQTQWYDPEHKVRVERIVPREDVGVMEVDTY